MPIHELITECYVLLEFITNCYYYAATYRMQQKLIVGNVETVNNSQLKKCDIDDSDDDISIYIFSAFWTYGMLKRLKLIAKVIVVVAAGTVYSGTLAWLPCRSASTVRNSQYYWATSIIHSLSVSSSRSQWQDVVCDGWSICHQQQQ